MRDCSHDRVEVTTNWYGDTVKEKIDCVNCGETLENTAVSVYEAEV